MCRYSSLSKHFSLYKLMSFFIFCQREFRKTIITQKVLVTQSSNIVHCNQHTQKPICADFQAFLNTFSLYKLMGFFFHFCQGELSKQLKILHFIDFDWGKMHWFGNEQPKCLHLVSWFWLGKCIKWLEWCIFRVQGVPNPMAQVSSLYNKQFLKHQNFRRQVA